MVGVGVEESQEGVTMQLTEAQISEFHEQGYLVLPRQFMVEEITRRDCTPIEPLEGDHLPDPAEQEGAPPALRQR